MGKLGVKVCDDNEIMNRPSTSKIRAASIRLGLCASFDTETENEPASDSELGGELRSSRGGEKNENGLGESK